jgi:hypothetical protein
MLIDKSLVLTNEVWPQEECSLVIPFREKIPLNLFKKQAVQSPILKEESF